MKFLVDNQLPPALSRLIETELGSQAVHVAEIGLRDAPDIDIWKYASGTESILISKDEDFADMVFRSPTAKLILVRIGNCRRDFLLELFRRIWPRILDGLKSGDSFLEIR